MQTFVTQLQASFISYKHTEKAEIEKTENKSYMAQKTKNKKQEEFSLVYRFNHTSLIAICCVLFCLPSQLASPNVSYFR